MSSELKNGQQELLSVIVRPFLSYIDHKYGHEGLEKIAKALGISKELLTTHPRWIPLEHLETIFTTGRAMMRDDEEFKQACVYEFKREYGIFSHLFNATSVRLIYTLVAKTMYLASRISTYEIAKSSHNKILLRYVSQKKESRLTCISRQADLAAKPMMFGLPPAKLKEHACIAHGDKECLYEISWYEQPRYWRTMAGILLGLLLTFATWPLFPDHHYPLLMFMLCGYLGGKYFEQRKINQLNMKSFLDSHQAMESFSSEIIRTNEELMAFNNRQDKWSQLVEQQIAERLKSMEHVLDEFKQAREVNVASMRDASHDLRNPLALIRGCHDYFARYLGTNVSGDIQTVMRTNAKAIEQLSKLINELVMFAKAESIATPGLTKFEVLQIAERLRGRLTALVFGQNIEVEVKVDSSVPQEIMIDEIIFDRITDNLLTNAAKYTTSGFIRVEMHGHDSKFCLRISDSGCGISRDQLELIFNHPGQESFKPLGPDSFRLGLSSVSHLLRQIGGRLEVSSKPGVGSTFSVYLPINFDEKKSPRILSSELSGHDANIVTILEN